MLVALKLFLGKSVWVPYQMKIKFYLACKCHLLVDRLVTWCVKQLTFNSRWLPIHLSSTLSFLSVSSLRLWMSSSGFNEVYGSCLQTFSGCYLYPSLCGRHLEWEKRVCHSQTVTFSFLIQKQDSLVIWLTVGVMSFGLGLCRWSERTIYLWMCLFSFLSYFLFWCLFLRVGHGCISSCGGRPWCAESQEAAIFKVKSEVSLLHTCQTER